MRFTCHRMVDLDHRTLVFLRDHLTNSPKRGDKQDGGAPVNGSAFAHRINDHIDGVTPFHRDTWAVIAHDRLELAGWCMVTRRELSPSGHRFSVSTADVGFYVAPSYRRHGLGSLLIQEACELARKNDVRRLLATPWNRASQAFFAANDFDDVTGLFTASVDVRAVYARYLAA